MPAVYEAAHPGGHAKSCEVTLAKLKSRAIWFYIMIAFVMKLLTEKDRPVYVLCGLYNSL